MTSHPSKPRHSTDVSPRTLIFGCGYLGIRVAKNAVFSGDSVWATTRSDAKAAELSQQAIEPLIADWTDRQTLRQLPEFDRVLISVSYDPRGGQSRFSTQVGGLGNLLEFLPLRTRICYISTTGVYGQRDGSWVDEDSAAQPDREGGRVHLQAEQLLQRERPGPTVTILRLAGIYGPRRVPRATDIKAGRPIASPADGYLNLIHVDDAAAVVRAAWSQARRQLYVVSDDCPVVRAEFYREISRRCSAPSPIFEPPGPDAPARMRSASNKRICNQRMKSDLVSELQYPTYREGLSDIL